MPPSRIRRLPAKTAGKRPIRANERRTASMNSEEKILSILETLVAKVDKLEAGQAKLEAGQAKLEAGQGKLEVRMGALEAKASDIDRKVDAIWEQTAHLTEFETESRINYENINEIIKVNTYDITRLRAKAI
jgi:hypothetical protein